MLPPTPASTFSNLMARYDSLLLFLCFQENVFVMDLFVLQANHMEPCTPPIHFPGKQGIACAADSGFHISSTSQSNCLQRDGE